MLWSYPMARLSSLRVGGRAEVVLFPSSTEELQTALAWIRGNDLPWCVIGRGTNILVTDEGLNGVVVVLGPRFSQIATVGQEHDKTMIRVEAGCSLPRLVRWCCGQALAGLEFAVGIPGSVGGGIMMNAGAGGKEIKQVITQVMYLDKEGHVVTAGRDALQFSYRSWHAPAGAVVVGGIFGLSRGSQDGIEAACQELTRRRLESQPQRIASAGSFFRNPMHMAAGALIEQAGMKGYKRGGAMVSLKHANFIVNTGTATARDIVDLMQEVQARVQSHSGVMLQPEVRLLGNWKGLVAQ